MDNAKQHWKILQKLGNDLENRVREFLVIGQEGKGLIVSTENGQGYWLGDIWFGFGELKTANEPTALDVPGPLVSMAQGNRHILLLNKRGEIYSMGDNYCGKLGLGADDNKSQFSPKLISIPQHKFNSVRCGLGHSLALTDDGKVWTWGANNCRQLGVSISTKFLSSPRQISRLDPHRIVAVECGSLHSLALTDQGEVYAWGNNYYGQLGCSGQYSKRTQTQILTPSPVQSMAAGDFHTLLLTLAGEVYACGWDGHGQLGFPPPTTSSPRLYKIDGLPPITQIASHTLANLSIAMSSDKRCFVWGQLTSKKFNEEHNCISISTPRELPSDYSTVDSPLSFSLQRYTPHSVSIPETPLNRLSARMSRMFDNPESSPDVQFVMEQRKIYAHRIILSNSSDYFAQIFLKKCLPQVDPVNSIVKVTITDHSYPIFHTFLRFLYTDCLELHSDLLPEMFELATQYLVPDLQQHCLSRMRITITLSTFCLYYPLTHRHSQLPELTTFQQELVQFAATRMSEVVNSAAYHSMEPVLCDQLAIAVQNLSESLI